MITRQAIIDGIYTKLISVQTAGSLYALVGGRIYDTTAGPNPTLPCAIFTVIDDPIQQYFDIDGFKIDFQVDVYGPILTSVGGPKASRTAGDAAMNLLHRASLTVTGAGGVSCLCQSGTSGLDVDYVAGGLTHLDAFRDTRVYRLFGTSNT